MKIFYLNLERRPDRNQRFLELNEGVADFERVDAVDGKTLDVNELIQENIFLEALPDYSSGAMGCAVSHKRLWEQCIANDSAMTVAEDDAIFSRQFTAKAESVLEQLPAAWDIILWGWNFDSILQTSITGEISTARMSFDHQPIREQVDAFQQASYPIIPLRLQNAFGTNCYTISPQGARQLTERCFPLRREGIAVPALTRMLPNYGIDIIMNKHYGSLLAFVCFPPLVWAENDKKLSDIHIQERRQSNHPGSADDENTIVRTKLWATDPATITVAEALQLALHHHRTGNLAQAEELYRKILYVNPGHTETLHYLGLIAHQSGRNDMAIAYIGSALRLEPNFADAHNNLGIALRGQARLDEAAASFQQALSLKPDFIEAHNNLGSVFQEQDRLDEALTCYQDALSFNPDHAEAHSNMALTLVKLGKYEAAVDSYRQAVRLKPTSAEAHFFLGNALKELGRLDDAVASYREALRFNPNFAAAHLNLKSAHEELGRCTAAPALVGEDAR